MGWWDVRRERLRRLLREETNKLLELMLNSW